MPYRMSTWTQPSRWPDIHTEAVRADVRHYSVSRSRKLATLPKGAPYPTLGGHYTLPTISLPWSPIFVGLLGFVVALSVLSPQATPRL